MGHILAVLWMYTLLYALLRPPPDLAPSGHYRLWVNGIHHGDISPNNLMYAVSPTGELDGVLCD